MNLTKALFSADEAFARLGQTRETGCLVVVSPQATVRIFVREACVVNAYSENVEGEAALKNCFAEPASSYVWFPGAKPPREPISLNITGYSLQVSIARDVHLSKTALVSLDLVDQSAVPAQKKPSRYYLVAEDKPAVKIALNKGSLIVGRDESCDIVLPRPDVSRRHCLLQQSQRGLSFRDLESANGTYINGHRSASGFVHSNDKFTFGGLTLTVCLEPK